MFRLNREPSKVFKHDVKADTFPVDMTLDEADPDDFDAVLPPGGANADNLRVNKEAQEFARKFDREQKPIAVICHGPWLLVSAGLGKGSQDDELSHHSGRRAQRRSQLGGQRSIRDRTWVSSRQPSDIPAFVREEMIALFAEHRNKVRRAA